MGHTFTSSLFHCVFATKGRQRWLTDEVNARLWSYLGGIARLNDMICLAAGGAADHVHLLMSLPATMPLAKAMQLVKGGSSKWVREEFPELKKEQFAWQDGYGAFSIGVSGVEETRRYIAMQDEHHRRRTFEEEFREFLRRHGLDDAHPHVLG
jgi:putative transposase